MQTLLDRQDPAQVNSFEGWLHGVFGQLEIVVSPPRSVVANLELDEALARAAAAKRRSVLRLWWGAQPTVVLGYSEDAQRVADLVVCERLGVAVTQRTTGGGAVLQTPGVLNYSFTAPAPPAIHLGAVFTIGTGLLIGALAKLGISADARGTSDVAVGDRKISGNAQARRWGGLLLHGTLLYDLDMELVASCLRHPPREPDYRRGRPHREFLTTLRDLGVPASPSEVEAALVATGQDFGRDITGRAFLAAERSEEED